MDRCQVVNTATGETSKPKAPIPSPNVNTSSKPPPALSQREIDSLEDIYCSVDDEFAYLDQHSATVVAAQQVLIFFIYFMIVF